MGRVPAVAGRGDDMSAEAAWALAGKQVLVTGGTGFIGGRLCERLACQCGAEVRALVRNFASASRLARIPVRLVRGDMTRPDEVAAAAAGCEVIFHCAFGTTGTQRQRSRVNVGGTRAVLAAAAACRASRLVHLSTLMVYGATPDGDLDETAPRRYFGDAYSNSKLRAEREVLRAGRRGLPVTVLQPTAVYGPYGGVWTELPLRQLASGRVILVNGGNGLANAVYVDDLVTAMLLAAVREEAIGEAFLISGAEAESWRELYGRFEQMLGRRCTVSMTATEARGYSRRYRLAKKSLLTEGLGLLRENAELRDRVLATREVDLLRWFGSSVVPGRLQQVIKKRLAGSPAGPGAESRDAAEPPIHPLSSRMVRFFIPKTRVRIDKATRLLGYRPAFDLDRGMAMTEAWARWANLLPPSGSPSEETEPRA